MCSYFKSSSSLVEVPGSRERLDSSVNIIKNEVLFRLLCQKFVFFYEWYLCPWAQDKVRGGTKQLDKVETSTPTPPLTYIHPLPPQNWFLFCCYIFGNNQSLQNFYFLLYRKKEPNKLKTPITCVSWCSCLILAMIFVYIVISVNPLHWIRVFYSLCFVFTFPCVIVMFTKSPRYVGHIHCHFY